MYDRGVNLLSGTDIPNFILVARKSLHHELELLSNTGIPTPGVIQIATKKVLNLWEFQILLEQLKR